MSDSLAVTAEAARDCVTRYVLASPPFHLPHLVDFRLVLSPNNSLRLA